MVVLGLIWKESFDSNERGSENMSRIYEALRKAEELNAAREPKKPAYASAITIPMPNFSLMTPTHGNGNLVSPLPDPWGDVFKLAGVRR